ncbi:MAG: hypothetical protein ABFR50_06730 [Candidatus Fermentibacteria bacterium]
MNSKTVLGFITASILISAVSGAPAAHADTGVFDMPATATIIEENWPDWSALTPEFEQTGTAQQISLTIEIDQNQPSGPVHMAAFNQTDLAQSFMQTNGNIAGAGILLRTGIGTSDNVTIQLWDALPNAGGTMLTEATVTGTAGQWVDVYWTAVEITPATTYYLVFTGNTTLGIAGDISNPYPDGHVFANPGYSPYPDFDYAFRTYYDTEVPIERHTWANVKSLFD